MGVSFSSVETDERTPILSHKNFTEDINVFNYLCRTKNFAGFDKSELKSLASIVSVKVVEKGQHIFEKGDSPDSFFFLVAGVVDLVIQNGKKLKSVLDGEIIGAFDFVNNWERQFSAISKTKCLLFQVDRNDLMEACAVNDATKPICTYFKKIKKIPDVEAFKDMALLSNVEEKHIKSVVQLFSAHSYSKGTTLLKEGVDANRCFFILKGEVVATLIDSNGFVRELSTVSSGGMIGERSLMSNKSPACTITSLTDIDVLVLKKKDFSNLLEICPKVKSVLTRRQRHFTTIHKLLDEMPVFSSLSQRKKLKLGYCVKKQEFAAGEVILEQNRLRKKDERYLYIVISGTAEIFRNDLLLGNVTKGQFFGELSLLDPSAKYQATIKAKDDVQCYLLNKDSFVNIFANEPVLLAEMIIKILGSKTPLSVLLKHPITKNSLLSHCKEEYSTENVEFWIAVDELENIGRIRLSERAMDALKIDNIEMDKRKEEILNKAAEHIVETFIREDSNAEINILGDLRNSIVSSYDNKSLTFDMFSEAKESVFLLLNNDTFTRYKRSVKFEAALKAITTYNAENKRIKDVDSKAFFDLLHTGSGVFGDDVAKKLF